MNRQALQFNKHRQLNTRRILDELFDPSFGIIQNLEEVPRFPDDPEFFHFLGKACNTLPISGQKNFYNSGGASIDKEAALFKAVGEAVERYSSAIYDYRELPLCTSKEADFPCIAPAEFALYSEAQYADPNFLFVPFTETTPVRWTEMFDLTEQTAVFGPAAAVYMPYTYIRGERDSPILQPISTGLACHRSLEEAQISAICEIIERDSVMITWQAMVSCPQIRIETLSDLNYEIVRRLEKSGSKVIILDITADNGVPTILSVLDGGGQPHHPSLIFAGAADPDPEKAVRKSLEELPHTRRYCARLMAFAPEFPAEFPDHGNVKDQEHHLHFYCDHRHRKYAEFVFMSNQRKSFDELPSLKAKDLKATLANLVGAVKSSGENIYLKDLTSPDIRALGLFVTRAVIPGYQRLCMGYRNRVLGGERLTTVPAATGAPSRMPAIGRDNPAPHPYP